MKKWSEIDDVKFPPNEWQLISLMKILSIRVAVFEVTLVGWRMRGPKLWELANQNKVAIQNHDLINQGIQKELQTYEDHDLY